MLEVFGELLWKDLVSVQKRPTFWSVWDRSTVNDEEVLYEYPKKKGYFIPFLVKGTTTPEHPLPRSVLCSALSSAPHSLGVMQRSRVLLTQPHRVLFDQISGRMSCSARTCARCT